MALVEGEQTPRLMALGSDDHIRISETCVEVLVPAFELRDDTVVVRLQVSNEPSCGQILDESETSSRPQPMTEQVVHFGGDGSRGYRLA